MKQHHFENRLIIAADNMVVRYIEEGSINTSTIIFIHGFRRNKSMWEKQIEALKDNYRVIAYDIRGHGNSNVGDANFSNGLFVHDLRPFMHNLKIDKAILCGFSMGGYTVLNAIENYPKRFNALLLCNTNCTADLSEVKENRIKTIEMIKEKGLEEYAEERMK
jgi:3-oxoadipate enol-lactonase